MSAPDDLEDTAPLRPNLRPLLYAVVANLVFGGALLGWPYLRGRDRAEEAAPAFARFAACLFDGEVAERPGITLPRGERARFATLVVRGDADWPARCRDELARVSPEPAIFLFPGVKSAEERVRAEVARLDRELAAIDREDPRVPAAPLDTLARLQGALSEHIRAAGVEVVATREAIVLGEGDDLPAPSIVPTQMGADRWWIALEGRALLVQSVDAASIGRVRVEDGRIDTRRARRPRLVSGMVGADPPWVIWSTPEGQCDDDAEGCAQRAMGVAALLEDRQRLAPSAWLHAHPAGDPADAVHVEGGAMFVAALGGEGLALRRFALPEPAADASQRGADLERAIEVEDATVRWIAGDPPVLAWAGEGGGTLAAREDAEVAALETPGGRATLTAAGRAEDGWVVVAGERELRVRRAAGGPSHAVALGPRPPGRGAVRVVCGAGEGCAAAHVLVLRDRALSRATCDESGCAEPERVAEGVGLFDAAAFGEAVLVAWSSGAGLPVRLTRLDASGAHTSIPAACWDTEDGLCGEPRLAADAERAVLVTRRGADLRVLESEDGRRFRALRGLSQP